MAKIFNIVTSLCHSAEREHLDGIVLRCILCSCKERTKFSGNILSAVCRAHLISEIADESPQSFKFLKIRLIMDTIDEGLCLLTTFCRLARKALASGSHKLGNAPVGKEHELLDKPVSFLRDLLIYIYRLAFLIHFDLHFRTVETDRTCSKPLLAKFRSKTMECKDSISDFHGNTFM